MKNTLLSLLTLAAISFTNTVQAQTATAEKPHRIGVIDMAHVFQQYKKFETLRNSLQAEIDKSDAQAKQMVEVLQKMQADLKKYDAGSSEYEAAEARILSKKGEFDSFRATTQRRLARAESDMFKQIYADVTDAVEKYAQYKKFDHVMRFNRKGIDDTTTPQEAVQTMNKNFIYSNPANDITDPVLSYLNRKFASAKGGTPARTVSGSK